MHTNIIPNKTENTQQLNIQMNPGKKIEFKEVEERTGPMFWKIGNGIESPKYAQPFPVIDALDAFSTFGKTEWYCFSSLKKVNNFTTIEPDPVTGKRKHFITCIVDMRENNPLQNRTEVNKFISGFNKLKKKNMVRRIRQQVYMINPMLLIPTKLDYEFNRWGELINRDCTESK